MTYLEGLNEPQRRAVLATEGPVSVVAGAGSGKTRVLTTRIYHLVRQGVPAAEILAVTFTNKAAREMRERVRALLGADEHELPLITTFHGLGRELLERYGRAVGVPRFFSIYDRGDSERVIAEALKALDIGARELSARAILARISRAKGGGVTQEEFGERSERGGYGSRVAALAWERYERALEEAKALDFDDLIALPVKMLREHAEVRARVEERWRYLHVDEYQDTNALQGELANRLAARHRNLFVVGDIDQTIYTWRGATIENLLTFEEDHPGTETIILEHNYRSTKNIVDAANRVIEQNKKRKEKRSVTDNPAGESIVVHVALNAEGEARFVAENIARALKAGRTPEEIAVLYRTNFQSRALEEALLAQGVPYRLLGTRFFERKEVKDALAWVRLALDPTREAERLRAAQSPPRGIGRATLGKLAAGKRGELRGAEEARVEAFEAVVGELATAAEVLTPSVFVKLVVERSGMRQHYLGGSLPAGRQGGDEDRERFENVQELASLAARYDATSGREGISAFLAEAALASDQDEMDRPLGEGRRREGGQITLMTVHAAKGLEFDTVFVTGLEEGLFPHALAAEENRDEEEERRLFYVAMTRAKQRLVLTLARVRKIYGADYLSEPSSFLNDLDRSRVLFDGGAEEPVIVA